MQGRLKGWLRRLASLLWAENKFNCSITGLRKAETDENIEAVKKMILFNRRITIREVANDVGISFGSCQVILTDVLGMKRMAMKIVPKLLNFEQKQRRIDITQEMFTKFNDDSDLLKKVITEDESWVYGYDIEMKAFSYNWGDKRKIETRAVVDGKKRVSEVFRGLEKNAGISVLYLRGGGHIEGDKIVIDK